ncbi:MAG: response regulator, partial [Nitrospira sp.]|nr:response regulator [Nitrospira sp.]
MTVRTKRTVRDVSVTSQRPKKILIVEDEREIAQLIKHYLEKEGYQPCIAETGLEAHKLVASEHPDLVILDLMLPEVDGLEVCKTLRRKPETAL